MHSTHVPGGRRARTIGATLAVAALAGTGLAVVAGPASAEVTSSGLVGDSFNFRCAPTVSGGNWVLTGASYDIYGAGGHLNSGRTGGPDYSVDVTSLAAGSYSANMTCHYVPSWDPEHGSYSDGGSASFTYAGATPTTPVESTPDPDPVPPTDPAPDTDPVPPTDQTPTDPTPPTTGDTQDTDTDPQDTQDTDTDTTPPSTPTTPTTPTTGTPATPQLPTPTASLQLTSNYVLSADYQLMATVSHDGEPVQGTVHLEIDGQEAGLPAHLDTDGHAWFSGIAPYRYGDYTYTLVFDGNPWVAPVRSAPLTLTVEPLPVQVSLGGPPMAFVGEPVSITVGVSGDAVRVGTPDGQVEVVLTSPGQETVRRTVTVHQGWGPAVQLDGLPAGEWTFVGTYTASEQQHAYATTSSVPRTFTVKPTVSSTPTPDKATTSPAAPVTAPAALPTAAVVPQLAGSRSVARADEQIDLVARDFLPGETVVFYLHSTPVLLGSAVADANGVATLRVTLPADAAPGSHHVQATGGTSGRVAEIPLTIVAPKAAASDGAAPAALAVTGSSARDMVVVQALLLVSGAGLLLLRRRLARRG